MQTLFAVRSQFWYAMFAILNLAPGAIWGTGGFQHTVINNTQFPIRVSLDYRSAFCKNENAELIGPGQRRTFGAGICMLTAVVPWFSDEPREYSEASKLVKAAGVVGKDARWFHGGFSGNGAWVITWDPVNKKMINTPHLNSLGDMIVSTANDVADWVGDRFGDTQATRAVDYGVRLAALETGYHAATQVLNLAKETADGSLVAAEATARTALQAAEGFLDSVVRNASQAVLKGPAEASKAILEGAKQGAVAVLDGAQWVTKNVIDLVDINQISCETELAELKKGVLGSVLVKGKVVNDFEVTITLDPKNVANSIVTVVNKGVDLLKDKVLNPLESAFKQNKGIIEKATKETTQLQASVAVAEKEAAQAQQVIQQLASAEQKVRIAMLIGMGNPTPSYVVSATYGDKNVSDTMKALVGTQPYQFAGGSGSMNKIFGDSTPGRAKSLQIIFYNQQGVRETKTVTEDAPFSLAGKQRDYIVQAKYGSRDVTAIMKQVTAGNSMKFTGKQGWMNQFFGGDPDPGKKKDFVVTVATEQGVQSTKTIPEDGAFSLP